MSKKINRIGIMLVISSPSGAGKTTLARRLVDKDVNINLSVSVTTRKKRKSEFNNKDYIFINNSEFDELIIKDKLLEYAEVFGNRYGTLKKPILRDLALGKDILFDIDWQGTQALKEKEPKHLVSVFILPPSTKDLELRLLKRGQDTEHEVKKRMSKANSEITHWPEYDYIIINDNLEVTLEKLRSILEAERLKRVRQTGLNDFVRSILN